MLRYVSMRLWPSWVRRADQQYRHMQTLDAGGGNAAQMKRDAAGRYDRGHALKQQPTKAALTVCRHDDQIDRFAFCNMRDGSVRLAGLDGDGNSLARVPQGAGCLLEVLPRRCQVRRGCGLPQREPESIDTDSLLRGPKQ